MSKSLERCSFGEALFALKFLAESDEFYDDLKVLAKEDVSVLKNLVNVQRLYRSNDPQLGGKEANLAISVVLQKLYLRNPKAAHYLGRMEWEPELVNWVGFLDQVGDGSLAEFLGITSASEIPIGKAGGMGDNLGAEQEQGDDLGSELAAALGD